MLEVLSVAELWCGHITFGRVKFILQWKDSQGQRGLAGFLMCWSFATADQWIENIELHMYCTVCFFSFFKNLNAFISISIQIGEITTVYFTLQYQLQVQLYKEMITFLWYCCRTFKSRMSTTFCFYWNHLFMSMQQAFCLPFHRRYLWKCKNTQIYPKIAIQRRHKRYQIRAK